MTIEQDKVLAEAIGFEADGFNDSLGRPYYYYPRGQIWLPLVGSRTAVLPAFSASDHAALDWLKALPGCIYWDISRFMNLKTNEVVYSVCVCWDWDDGTNDYIQVRKSDGEHKTIAAALTDAVLDLEPDPTGEYHLRIRLKPSLKEMLDEQEN